MGRKIKLVKKIPIIQIGSYVQQNFGESIKHHGFGIYDIENDKYNFHDIENDTPFLHFEISDINDIENGKEKLLNIG